MHLINVIPTSPCIWTVIARSAATKQSSWIATARYARLAMTKALNLRDVGITPRQGVLEFNRTGTFRGNCPLICHGRSHFRTRY